VGIVIFYLFKINIVGLEDKLDEVIKTVKAIQLNINNDLKISNMRPSEIFNCFTPINCKEVSKLQLIGDSVMSLNEVNVLIAINASETVNLIHMTPFIDRIFRNSDTKLFNCELSSWIHTILEHKENFQRCDLIAIKNGLEVQTEETGGTEIIDLRTFIKSKNNYTYLFAKAEWEIKEFLDCIIEFKVGKLSNAFHGELFDYLLHLSRNNPNCYYGMLCNRTDFFVCRCQHSAIFDGHSGKWTDAGSLKFLQDYFVARNPYLVLLNDICKLLKVSPFVLNGRSSGYLGKGKFGLVFSVCDNNTKELFALKIVLANSADVRPDIILTLAIGEYEKLIDMHNRSIIGVVHAVKDSFRRVYFKSPSGEKQILGAGYLIYEIGKPIQVTNKKNLERLLYALQELHAQGEYHGDARFTNAIEYYNKIIWIDFMIRNFDIEQRRMDLNKLVDSIGFNNKYVLIPEDVVKNYVIDPNEATMKVIIDIVLN
jgi:hypothetical protein